MAAITQVFRSIVRFFVVWFIDTVSLLITAWLITGMSIEPAEGTSKFVVAVAIALVLGIVNLLIRPLLLLIAVPLGWMVVFLAGFFINAVTLMITSLLIPALQIDSWWIAFLGGLFLALVNTILTSLLDIDDDNSFYDNLVQRQAVRFAGDMDRGTGRGLVILETDGLSYQRIQKAIADGYMPTLKQMIAEDGYKVTRVDCGIPPTTPACQAGILQGNNTNIPAFRWLDKKTGKLLAGGQAAEIIEPELSDGNGLLRGGTSIGNMFSGDAATSILTFSKIKAGTPEDKKQRARDMFLLMRNPYFFVRSPGIVFWRCAPGGMAGLAAAAQERPAAPEPAAQWLSFSARGGQRFLAGHWDLLHHIGYRARHPGHVHVVCWLR